MAAAGETAEHGTPRPLYAVGSLLAGARTALGWRRDQRSRGALESRESLTQDSRSAVKARQYFSIRYANHSAAGVAPVAQLA